MARGPPRVQLRPVLLTSRLMAQYSSNNFIGLVHILRKDSVWDLSLLLSRRRENGEKSLYDKN